MTDKLTLPKMTEQEWGNAYGILANVLAEHLVFLSNALPADQAAEQFSQIREQLIATVKALPLEGGKLPYEGQKKTADVVLSTIEAYCDEIEKRIKSRG